MFINILIADQPHPCAQFVNRAVCFNADVIFWYARSADQSRATCISCFSVYFQIPILKFLRYSCEQLYLSTSLKL